MKKQLFTGVVVLLSLLGSQGSPAKSLGVRILYDYQGESYNFLAYTAKENSLSLAAEKAKHRADKICSEFYRQSSVAISYKVELVVNEDEKINGRRLTTISGNELKVSKYTTLKGYGSDWSIAMLFTDYVPIYYPESFAYFTDIVCK